MKTEQNTTWVQAKDTKKIVDKAWNFAHVLRDDGLSYMAYTEQITFPLFLKMADEQSKPSYRRARRSRLGELAGGEKGVRSQIGVLGKLSWPSSGPEGYFKALLWQF